KVPRSAAVASIDVIHELLDRFLASMTGDAVAAC
ncbi:MAG: hypothetical protein ACI9BK_002900, partial [Acidimicrobiales bacterium]